MLDFLELEETVGRAWHRFAGNTGSYARFPEAAVTLEEVRPMLGPFFRALGGEKTVQVAPARARTSAHRLRLRQYVGLGEERIEEAARDHRSLMLPQSIDLFPERALNRDLYIWLSAFMAAMPHEEGAQSDPLLRDLDFITRSAQTARGIVLANPGLGTLYRRLAGAVLDSRRRGPLPRAEGGIENRILNLLRDARGEEGVPALPALPPKAPPGYLPALPVPLWPRFAEREETLPRQAEELPPAGSSAMADCGRKVAVREKTDGRKSERSPFILNRFEKILSLSEMLSVDRPADDSDDQAKTADDLEDMTLGERRGKPASRFRFDLDLPPEALEGGPLAAEHSYPEWDYRSASYLPGQVRVIASTAKAGQDPADQPDEEMQALIRRVRRQFEILRPRPVLQRAQLDGPELDLDQVVRRLADLSAGGEGTDRIHAAMRPRGHDLAATILVDVSLSTDAWVDNRRIIDVEKQALLTLAHGLAACGDRYSILSFTSRRRDWVRLETLKAFDETMSAQVEARIAGLKPGYYTRIGAAIRHAAAGLRDQPNSRKLLLVLTDGKPNDIDYYEGRFALEDSRRAVIEAKRAGISVFGVTIDRRAEDYLPALFGRNGYALVSSLARLPQALPAIYRGLAG